MRAARLWPIAIVAVLGSTVVANVALLIATHGDASQVEPDYYRKAVTWDSTLAARRRSDALGWSAEARLGDLDGRGNAVLEVRLADRSRRSVAGARTLVTAVHNLDPSHPVRAALVETEPGSYRAEVALARAGLWELRLDAVRGGERFIAEIRTEGIAGPGVVASVGGPRSRPAPVVRQRTSEAESR